MNEENALASLQLRNNPSGTIRLLKPVNLSIEGGKEYGLPKGHIIYQTSSGAIHCFTPEGKFIDKGEIDKQSSSFRKMELGVDYEYADVSVVGRDGSKLVWRESKVESLERDIRQKTLDEITSRSGEIQYIDPEDAAETITRTLEGLEIALKGVRDPVRWAEKFGSSLPGFINAVEKITQSLGRM